MRLLDEFLSEKGKRIAWPAKGILQQTADAKGSAYNATIGVSLEDDGSPMHLESMRVDCLVPAQVFPYAPGFGVKELREAWKAGLERKNPSFAASCSLPVVTAGMTHALHIAGHLFLDQGDPLILPELYWGNYRLLFEHTFGAELVACTAFAGEGFNAEGMGEALLAPGEKKLLLLNFPNNPTGYTPTLEEAHRLVALIEKAAAAGKRVIVILDDAYFGLVYEEGILEESLFSQLADCHENVLAVKADGATKEEYAFGLRVGFLTYAGKGLGAEDLVTLEEKTAAVMRATASNAANLSQHLVLKGLRDPEHEVEKERNRKKLQERYLRVKELVKEKGLETLPFNSGFFMCVRLPGVSDAENVRQRLLSEYDTGVIALPGNLLRIAYSGVPTEKLERLFENISAAINE